jgi:AcrR family transcriptional regulator
VKPKNNRLVKKKPLPGKKEQATKEKALTVAEVMLSERGYLGMSMEEIAKSIGIRKASLYHHFPGGKEEMVAELAEQVLKRAEAGILEAVSSGRTAKVQLEALMALELSTKRHTETMLRDAMRFMKKSHQDKIALGFMTHMFSPIHEVFQRGVANGEFRKHNTELAVWLFMSMTTKLSEDSYQQPTNTLSDQALELFFNGICN